MILTSESTQLHVLFTKQNKTTEVVVNILLQEKKWKPRKATVLLRYACREAAESGLNLCVTLAFFHGLPICHESYLCLVESILNLIVNTYDSFSFNFPLHQNLIKYTAIELQWVKTLKEKILHVY